MNKMLDIRMFVSLWSRTLPLSIPPTHPHLVAFPHHSPTLCLNAFDDPIIASTHLPLSLFAQSSHAVLAIVGTGGHLGHFTGGQPFFKSPSRWLHLPVGEFLRAAEAELVDVGEDGAERKREVKRVEGKVGWEVVTAEEGQEGAFTWRKRQRVWKKIEVE